MKRILILLIMSVCFILTGCTKNIGLKDIQSPYIINLKSNEITLAVGSEVPNWLDGFVVYDTIDGDLKSQVKLDSNVNMNQIGTYEVTYSVIDQAGHTVSLKMKVHIKDQISPIISGYSNKIIGLNMTSDDLLNHVAATDNYDGILTDQIILDDSNVNYNLAGNYHVIYRVKDQSGNETKIISTVTIQENDEMLQSVDVGETINLVQSNLKSYLIGGVSIFNESVSIIKDLSGGSYEYTNSKNIVNTKALNQSFKATNYYTNPFFKEKVDEFNREIDLISYNFNSFYLNQYNMWRYLDYSPVNQTNIRDFEDQFNQSYLNDLENLQNNSLTYEQFFNIYGTHYVARGVYGGKFEMFCGLLSNQSINSEELSSCTQSPIEVSPGLETISIYHANNFEYVSVYTQGGEPIIFDADFSQKFSSWVKSINRDTSVLVSYEDGLIPLWELLPERYSHLSHTMEDQYYEYSQKNDN